MNPVLLAFPVEINLTFPLHKISKIYYAICEANKKGKARNSPVPAFPSPSGIFCMTQRISLEYSIMKHKNFFKHNSHFQSNISECYARQAAVYQSKYNRKHPRQHIWRHMLYKRTFYFYLYGRHISVEVEIVRFRFAGTNVTFTFYGTLFCAYTHFSTQFIKQAVSSSDELLSPSALIVSVKTLKCWAEWIRNGRILSHELPKTITP